jgi:hypothetical protein
MLQSFAIISEIAMCSVHLIHNIAGDFIVFLCNIIAKGSETYCTMKFDR